MRYLILLLLSFSAYAAPTYKVDLAIVTDWDTVQYFSSPELAKQAFQDRIDIANDRYMQQMNIEISASYFDIPTRKDQDTLPTHTNPEALLSALKTYRASSNIHMARSLTILLTARDLAFPNQNVAGYANNNSFCMTSGVAEVEVFQGPDQDGETLAHEIGHTLGAVHDGEGVCASTQSSYIMWIHQSLATQFSQCSIDTIQKNLAISGECLRPPTPKAPVVSVDAPTPAQPSGGGGSTGLLFSAALALLAVAKRKLLG